MQEAVLEATMKTVPGTGLGTTSGTEMGTEMGTGFTLPLDPAWSPPDPRPLPQDTILPSAGSSLSYLGEDLNSAREGTQKNPEATMLFDAPGAWQEALRTEVRELLQTTLSGLSADQRFCLSRYHCLAFGNCARNETRNKYRATSVASGIANLARHKDYGQLLVWEYVAAAQRVHVRRDSMPWFSPWSIVAELEVAQ